MFQSSITRWHFIGIFLGFGLITAAFGLFIFNLADSEVEVEHTLAPVPERVSAVLDFWFGSDEGKIVLDGRRLALWEEPNDIQKETIRSRFTHDFKLAQQGNYDDWGLHPRGRLALLLLLDSIPHIIYKGTMKDLDDDEKALKVALEGIRLNQDADLEIIERAFFYHPLTNTESLEIQNRAVGLYERLWQIAPDDKKDYFEKWLNEAKKTRDVIYEFGRFPERNKLLNRKSSAPEAQYLETPKKEREA